MFGFYLRLLHHITNIETNPYGCIYKRTDYNSHPMPDFIKTNELFVQKEFLLQMTKRLLLWFAAINAKNWKNYEKRKVYTVMILMLFIWNRRR